VPFRATKKAKPARAAMRMARLRMSGTGMQLITHLIILPRTRQGGREADRPMCGTGRAPASSSCERRGKSRFFP
jgi:hypothetical protein